MAAPAILETALYCDDLEAAKRFYGELLGLEIIVEVQGRHVFFRLAGSVLLIFDPKATSTAESSSLGVPPHGATGPGHACFRADGAELDRWKSVLENAGVAVEKEVTWPNGPRSFYFRDPAGNSLEFGEASLWGV